MWSDNCSTQNKNWLFFFFIAWLVYSDRLRMVDLKFLLKGHSFMLPDSVFGRINTEAKGYNIEMPYEWLKPMLNSGAAATQVLPHKFIELLPLL